MKSLKQPRKLFKGLRKHFDTMDARYIIDRYGSVILSMSCGKGMYRASKKTLKSMINRMKHEKAA